MSFLNCDHLRETQLSVSVVGDERRKFLRCLRCKTVRWVVVGYEIR